MSGRVDHPNESTNAAKGKPSKLALIASYLVIWIAAIVVFWAFAMTYAESAMGYSLMFLWITLPATTLVVSFLIGRNDYWGRGKWVFSIGFGVMYMLAEYATFSMANNLAFGKVNMPEASMVPAGAAISLVGMALGYLVFVIRRRSQRRS
ncbi:hypothetical protein QP551_06875 [Slackia exigua]|uniref:hypothetical protein n=1 Tax=Slackia exigua TaxID=84109 RepID=UPI00254E7FA9|nr:hypothetical protein [Slackia exigua]MDK7724415.1 hypothetical protein [Slackia exigua]MDK7725742.1 hypothetical protein [Slackia exigua]